jgi:hypothetical protein
MNRLVVCFRVRGAAVRTTGGCDLATAVEDVVARTLASGGRVVAWDAPNFTFDFPPDGVEDVIDLATGNQIADEVLEAFSIGISQGDVSEVVDAGSGVMLSLGPALTRAAGLARIARAGEVLLDPLLPAVTGGELLTRGSRLGTHGRQRVRGLVLDLFHPWRLGVAVSPSRLVVPELVGYSINGTNLEPGTLGVVVAGRGQGGSRFLDELSAKYGSVLRIDSRPVGEPLGALRMALLRARAQGHDAQLPALHEASLESLLAGEGLDLEASGALVAAWLGSGTERYVVVDDASEVDADTLEAVAEAVRTFEVRAVARVDERGGVPRALAGLPGGFEVRLLGLGPDEAGELALAFTARKLEVAAATQVARRGGDSPLGIAEALREGLESGGLEWSSDSVAPRSRQSVQGDSRSAEHWMLRRLRFLDANARAVLDGLAILGGEADAEEITGLLQRVGLQVDLDAARDLLDSGCWTTAIGPSVMALSSATCRDLLQRVMAPDRFAEWHATAAALRADSGRPRARPRFTRCIARISTWPGIWRVEPRHRRGPAGSWKQPRPWIVFPSVRSSPTWSIAV